MAITNAANTIDLRYAASAKARAAFLAFEALDLTSNPSQVAQAEAAVAAAINAFIAAGGSAVATGSTNKVISSAVKFTGPAVTGSWVNGYTATIVNGVITAIVAS